VDAHDRSVADAAPLGDMVEHGRGLPEEQV